MVPPNRRTDYERKDIPQAVIIGESFDNQFDPITREIPKILLPLVNNPILDYNLHWLHQYGVEDVILYCRSTPFSAKIKKHCMTVLDRQQWKTMSVRVIASDDIQSTGDALRDLYRKRLIVGDFILMRGDSVSSIDLCQMMEVHKANKQYDSKTAVTCLFMPMEMTCDPDPECPKSEAEDRHGCSDGDSPGSFSTLRVSTITTLQGKILSYCRHRRGSPAIFLPSVAYEDSKVLIAQMPDPNISICSRDIPSLFVDNYECMTMDDLVKGLVDPDDVIQLNDCSVYQHIIREGYAATIATWKDYERVSMTITQRLLHPLCPEVSLTSGRHRYMHNNNNSYWTASGSFGEFGYIEGQSNNNNNNNIVDVKHGDLASFRKNRNGIGSRVVCGEAIEVSSTARARSCVFGNLCRIGDKADLERAFVGDNCSIESGCVVRQCYLGNNVTLLHDTVLEPGCVVASGVTLGPNQTVTRATLVATRDLWNTLGEFEQDGDPVSISSNGFIFPRLSYQAVDNTDDYDYNTPAAAGFTAYMSDDEDSDDDSLAMAGFIVNMSDIDSDYDTPAAVGFMTNMSVYDTPAAVGFTTNMGIDDSDYDTPAAAATVSEPGFTTNRDGQLLPVWGLKEDDFILVEDVEDDCGDVMDAAGGGDDDVLSELQLLRKVMDILVTGIRQKNENSMVVLEINYLRITNNIPVETIQELVFKSVLWCYEEAENGGAGAECPDWDNVRKGLFRYRSVLTRYLRNTDDFLNTIERMVCRDANVLSYADKLLHELSRGRLERIEDAPVLLWFERGGARRGDQPSSDGFFKLKEKVSTFLTWLETPQEESSEEEEYY